MNNRIKTGVVGLTGVRLHMLVFSIATVVISELFKSQQFLSTFHFWVKGKRRRKNKDGQSIPKFTGAFTVCLSLDTNDGDDTPREKMEMFPLRVTRIIVLS